MKDNYYHILGLDNFASKEEIKKAYRTLAKQYHPDKKPGNPDLEEQFKRINKAYQVLSDPVKKQQFDYQLLSPQISTAPRYTARKSYYSTERRRYTPTAWMYGKIFIILFIMAVILIPLTLLYQSSVRAYDEGMEAYENGDAYEALSYFNRAIMMFGGRSEEASIKGAEISYYELNNHKQALYFANRGLEYAENPHKVASLYYLKALSFKGLQNYNDSKLFFHKADSLHYSEDSIQLQLGLLNGFSLDNYEEGEQNFDYLIRQNIKLETAWFGKGWCLQNQGQFEQAINCYSEVITINKDNSLAWFYRGMNHITLSDSASACHDFKQSLALGYQKAESSFIYHCTKEDPKNEN
ncbi:Chaperone protein DnaJ [Fulvivirga imtechensis AK7]|uniref:Chaperone protein DnaJ n=1 Tax=Fulvivirga imtechensis AK7 TaxID=1237149 RepID=L8K086_9BACT|nr:DnaJ domain-containing protein [Fulvivirga imtechensis]ELR73798.1 Chaperone protein DnaJ [Fulvivirga imtechensis AK7]